MSSSKKYSIGCFDIMFSQQPIWQMCDAGFFFRLDLGKIGLVYWKKQT